ncbi:acyltransferase [Actinosynnema sp. NPDC050436]|uniref:acyltransferase family protein n=1 Tax=Actinosynnema sp. NPDC050436 TaxID=3155659 RepID=UPI00340A6A34
MTTTVEPPRTPTRRTGYMHGLDLLRVVGSCAVVLTHLVAWFGIYDRDLWLVGLVESAVVEPLHINKDMHVLGVAVFLVVSGVVVTHVADRETPTQFLRRRVVRLLPLLWVVTALAWVALRLGYTHTDVDPSAADVGALVDNLLMVGFFQSPPMVLLGVTWTLLVQIGFYVYVAATIPVLRRWPWVPPLAAAALCFVVILATQGSTDLAPREIRGLIGYLPLLCLGQLISLVHSRKITPMAGVAVGAAHFLLVVWVDKQYGYAATGAALPRTLMIALLVTIVLVSVHGPVSRSAFIRSWAKRTYAVYLVHIPVMLPLFVFLVPHLDATLVIVVGLVAVAVVTEVVHRFVEVPADRAVRRWEGRRQERRSG